VICGECGEREAEVHLTQVVGGEAKTLALCGACAAEKGIQAGTPPSDTPLGLFLSTIWEGAAQAPEGEPAGRCPRCGATFADFRDKGRLGCDACWTAFEAPLRVLIRRYHGSTRHLGRRPGLTAGAAAGGAGEAPTVEELRDQLRRAVEAEDFERAASLRDQLRNRG